MDKLAQEESPLLTTQIGSEPLVKNVWDKYFAPIHAKVIRLLRTNIKNEPGLQTALTSAFPGFSWPEFADMPLGNTLSGVKNTIDRLMSIPQVQQAPGIQHAAQEFMDQYNLMIKQLQHPAPVANKMPAKKPAQPSPKIKQLQQLLGVPSNGLWNSQTNQAFLSWLQTNGWDKYVVNNRFTGKIDDAIEAMLVEKASPGQGNPVELAGKPGSSARRAHRIEALKKLGQ